MSKREYTIKLVLDDSLKPDASSNTGQRWDDETKFVVTVNTNAPKDKAVDLAAHELGHVLGAIFKTPGWKADPRTVSPQDAAFMNVFGPSPRQRDGMVASEKEAWEIAEKVYPNLDKERKRWALSTYENAGW